MHWFARASSALVVLACSVAFTACDEKDASSESTARNAASSVAAAPAAPPPSQKPAEPKPPEKPKRPKEPLNVMLITVDSLRDDMPWNGYERPIAPNLTKLAEQSVVYENYRSVSSYTAQTVATFLTGRYASTLYRQGVFFTGYSQANEFITEAMQDKGIRTMSVQAHMYFGRGKGLEQGFDIWELVKGITFDAQTDNHVTSEKSAKRLMELLGDPENTKGQFFLWSHFMDPHDQYKKHAESPDFGNNNRDRYDSEVWYTDKWLGELFEFCKKQPWWDKTALIVTADHGEAFGEHDMYKHAFEIWDVLTRVPLIVKTPGAEPMRITQPRTHIDLAPTIVDLMGLSPLEGFQGESLVPEIYGAEEPEKRDVIVLELAEDSHNAHRRAIVVGDYKLIVYESGWKKLLFNLKDDPGETKDLAKAEPEKMKEMEETFEKTFDAIPSIRPYGGSKLKSGKIANGPSGPPKGAEEKKAK